MAEKKVEVGKKVPNFKIDSSSDEKFQLSKQKGNNIVIYFYPKDSTPGCTNEGLDFKKHYKKFQKLNTLVFGISRDSIASHKKFIEKQDFPFNLLSDEEEMACDIFDVLKIKNMYGRKYRGIERSTFFIDKKGYLQEEWRKVKVKDHVEAVLKFVQEFEK